jgi:hypothetical protein
MIISALSGRGGFEVLLAGARVSVPAAAEAAIEAPALNTQVAPAAKSTTEAMAASPTNVRSREHHSARWLLAAV